MNGTYLIDTNAAIARIAGTTALETLLEQAGEIFIPSIVLGELFFGAENSAQVEANLSEVERFAAGGVILTCDLETARQYGRIRKQLQAKGRPIPENDIWIAAIAKQYALTVLTSDKHFEHVDELAVQAW